MVDGPTPGGSPSRRRLENERPNAEHGSQASSRSLCFLGRYTPCIEGRVGMSRIFTELQAVDRHTSVQERYLRYIDRVTCDDQHLPLRRWVAWIHEWGDRIVP